MASRRRLKKTMKFITSELITEIYFRYLIKKDADSEKIEKMVLGLVALGNEFLSRANRVDGKSNPDIVKSYYRRLYTDWQLSIEKVIKEIETI